MPALDRLHNPFRAPAGATSSVIEANPPDDATAPTADALTRRLRPMTGYEEEFVELHAAEANTARLVNQLLARCLVSPGADHAAALAEVRAMGVAARNRALVALRRLSLGPAIEANAACPACGAANAIGFSLDDLPPPGAAVIEPNETVETVLPSGVRAVLRLPDAADQEALIEAAAETRAARLTLLLARVLVRLDDQPGPFDAAFARALPIADRQALDAALEAGTPRFELAATVVCERCAHSFSAPFDVQTFFLPK